MFLPVSGNENTENGAFMRNDAETFFKGKTACCFTGHRPAGLPDEGTASYSLLRTAVMDAVSAAVSCGVTRFLAGGARGFDTVAAEAVLFLREREGLPLTLTLALPSARHAASWHGADLARFNAIREAANDVYFAADSNLPYAMLSRNRYLVDHADCCIAYLKQTTGGTLYTVSYALEKGLPVLNLAEWL